MWPAAGVALAALLARGNAVAPGIFLANFAAFAIVGTPLPAALAMAVAATAGPALVAWILRRLALDLSLDSLTFIGRYAVFACTQAILVLPSVGVAALAATGALHGSQIGDLWALWAMANCLGVLSVTPVLLWFYGLPAAQRRPRNPLLFWSSVALLLVVTAGCYALTPPVGYPVLLVVMLIAVRQTQFETAIAVLAAVALAMAESMYRPHLPIDGDQPSLIRVLDFLVFMSAGALMLGGLIAESRRKDRLLLRANQDRLDLSENRFENAFEASAQGMAIVALDGRWLRVNAALCEMLGYSNQEMLAQTFRTVTHPDDLAQCEEVLSAMSAGKVSTVQFEKRYIHKGGRVVTVAISVSPVRDAAGAPLNHVVQIMDITDRKRAEELWRFGLESAGDVVWDWDVPAERITFTGRINELVGEGVRLGTPGDWRVLMHSDDLARVQLASARMITEPGHHFHVEYRIRRSDDSWRWVLSRGTVIVRDQQDRALRAIGTIVDITDMHRMQDKLHQSDKMSALGQLSGGVAHDVNNDLGVIVGSAEMILEQAEPGSRDAALAERIVSTVRRSRDLVRRMLAFSRQAEIAPEPLELADFLRGFIATLGRTLGAHVRTRLEAESNRAYWVNLDSGMLESCLINLSINARDAMPGGGTLSFRLAEKDGCVCLTVSDTGAGMSDGVRRHIFEPFFTTKPAGGGTGLGLSMVYGFVEQSGGQIEVESREGKGTCFLLSFPAVAAPAVRPPRPAPAPLAQKRACKVLLVDDNATLRQTLREQIVSLNCAVVEAADYAEAVAALGADPEIDFILTDLDLGDGPDGIALARWVRDNGRTLPGAVISGHLKTLTGLPTNWQSLAKPIQLAQLKALLATDLPITASPLILVVEDHDDMRFIATETLKRRGYGVIEAASGRDALETLKFVPGVALVLSDVGLPDMTGRHLAEEIARLRPGLTVLLMSGSLSQRDFDSAGETVLQKPFSRESLTRFVEDALARGTASQ